MAAKINPDAHHMAHCALEPSSVRIAASSATAERRNDARKNFSFPEAMTGNPSAINIKHVATTPLTIFLLRKGGKSLSSSAEMPKNITTIPQQRSTKVAMMNEALAMDSIFGAISYFGTAHDFLLATTSLMFCNFARRFISRMAFPIAARISGSVGLPTSRLSLRASVVFAIYSSTP